MKKEHENILERDERVYREETKKKLQSLKGDIVFFSDGPLIEDFMGHDGKLIPEAYYDYNCDKEDMSYEEFLKIEWDKIVKVGLIGETLVYLLFPDGDHRFLFKLQTERFEHDSFKIDLAVRLSMVKKQLTGEKNALHRILYKNEPEKDNSWKAKIWIDYLDFEKDTKNWLSYIESYGISDESIIQTYTNVLKNILNYFPKVSGKYRDESELVKDRKKVEDMIEEAKNIRTEEKSKDDFICIPAHYNSLSCDDVVLSVRNWLKINLDMDNVKLRYTTREEKSKAMKPLHDLLMERLKKVEKEISDKPMDIATKEYMCKKFSTISYYGRCF